ncbi:MAG: hypothetical protein ACOX6V_00890 [Patescibacteria group bacterium]|jgi:hypothetical protein
MRKVFFSSTPRGKKELMDNYKLIHRYLRELGHIHINGFPYSSDDFYFSGDIDLLTHHTNKNISDIKEADMAIFEASTQSLGVGFLINRALELEKPTLVLHIPDRTPLFIEGIENERLRVMEYTKANLRTILEQEIMELTKLIDQRFTMLLSTDLVNHLDDVAEKGIPRSEYIRNLIKKDMESKA